MGITLDRLVFDSTNAADSANVGAYLRAADGTLITHTGGFLDVNIASSTGLGIYAEDSAHTSGDLGQQILAVRNDTEGSLVSADGDYAPLQVDSLGRLRAVVDLDTTNLAEKAEDSAHASADIGDYVLSVRQDTLASSTSASGDYQSFKTDALGRLWMNQTAQTAAYGATSIANTATDIIATDLTNRMRVIVQNASNKDVFIGSNASVTTSNGTRLSAGASIELEIGPAVNLHGITSSGTADVRYFEVA